MPKLGEKWGGSPRGAEAAGSRSHVGTAQLLRKGLIEDLVAVTLKVTEGVHGRLSYSD